MLSSSASFVADRELPHPETEVLVLNFDYTPVNIVRGRRAIVLLLKERAHYVSVRVIRLGGYVSLPLSRTAKEKPTKAAIYRRDGYTCQYCGSTRNLTIDHLIPKCRGGQDTWENLLLACSKCNMVKGHRTPEQSGLKLGRKPRPPLPKVIELVQSSTDPEWSQYGYGTPPRLLKAT
jgi:5-methylcytosine-specific restriction endonuclease McrA